MFGICRVHVAELHESGSKHSGCQSCRRLSLDWDVILSSFTTTANAANAATIISSNSSCWRLQQCWKLSKQCCPTAARPQLVDKGAVAGLQTKASLASLTLNPPTLVMLNGSLAIIFELLFQCWPKMLHWKLTSGPDSGGRRLATSSDGLQ